MAVPAFGWCTPSPFGRRNPKPSSNPCTVSSITGLMPAPPCHETPASAACLFVSTPSECCPYVGLLQYAPIPAVPRHINSYLSRLPYLSSSFHVKHTAGTVGVRAGGSKYALCSGLGGTLHPHVLWIIEAFLLSTQKASQFFYSTLSMASLSLLWAGDLLLADEDRKIVVQIRSGTATVVEPCTSSGSYSFPAIPSVGSSVKFVVMDVTSSVGASVKGALARELAAIRDAQHLIILALKDRRVCGLARSIWDEMSLTLKQIYQDVPDTSLSLETGGGEAEGYHLLSGSQKKK